MAKIKVGDNVVLTFNTEINGAVITKEDIGEVADVNEWDDDYFFVTWEQYSDNDDATVASWFHGPELEVVNESAC